MDASARKFQPIIRRRSLAVGVSLALLSGTTLAQDTTRTTPRDDTTIAMTPATNRGESPPPAGRAPPDANELIHRGGAAPAAFTGNASLPRRVESLDLSLDLEPMRVTPTDETLALPPAKTPARGSAMASSSAPLTAWGMTSAAALPGASAARARPAADTAGDIALEFNVKGFSLLHMDGDDNTGLLQFRRIREPEWRSPALSITLKKRF